MIRAGTLNKEKKVVVGFGGSDFVVEYDELFDAALDLLMVVERPNFPRGNATYKKFHKLLNEQLAKKRLEPLLGPCECGETRTLTMEFRPMGGKGKKNGVECRLRQDCVWVHITCYECDEVRRRGPK